ncbi:LysR family transcriptional regulator [Microbacterium protaetiae]|uniref:LysR family transcriptional regulator n=1 Tax=Microbacterium protaetiae TaxID=2509458 RepID=A0A4P6EI78_9MICO|nr:LysR family transcriptional regulator [Microbacterium protaetiae]QAY61686.1 LysR family transcriptional regulator [Microbacterium protaetiae]
MFELRRLRMLHELALRGSLAAVADALAYSPSTISQQLALLEREARVRLLEPDGRGVRLTAQGHLLADYAGRMLQLDEQAGVALGQPIDEPVRVAVMQTAAQTLLAAALTTLALDAPELRVEVSDVPPEEGLFELSARRFDLVLAEQYPGSSREHRADLDRQPIGRDPIRLATPPGDDATGLAALADRAWVMEPKGTAARRWALEQCRAVGFEPDVRFEIADLTTQVRLIAAGHAVGMLPDLVWTGTAPSVRTVELPGSPTRELFTAARRATASRSGILAVRSALQNAFRRRSAPRRR